MRIKKNFFFQIAEIQEQLVQERQSAEEKDKGMQNQFETVQREARQQLEDLTTAHRKSLSDLECELEKSHTALHEKQLEYDRLEAQSNKTLSARADELENLRSSTQERINELVLELEETKQKLTSDE